MDITEEVMDILNAFSEEVEEIVEEEVAELSAEIVRVLQNHPKIPTRTGKYRKSFKVKKENVRGRTRHTVYNDEYQLTHLLERGHALPQGGRAKAYPHWEDAQRLAEEFPDRIEKRLGGK